MKNTFLFFTGPSGSGKSYFINNVLSRTSFYKLKSATTRAPRKDEKNGREYYFRDEEYFDIEHFATKLWVNEAVWEPGKEKWMYGVPEFEIFDHIGENFTYDVIQPCYVKQMIDWFYKKRLNNNYDFKIIWFQPTGNTKNIIQNRQNMPDDMTVRKMNTCNLEDFKRADLDYDFIIRFDPTIRAYFASFNGDNRILPDLTMDNLLREYGKKTNTIIVLENFSHRERAI